MSMQPWEEAYEYGKEASRLRAENKRLRAAIAAWAMAEFPEVRSDPHDLDARAAMESARQMAETTLYAIFKEGR